VSKGRWVSGAREYILEDNGWTQWASQTLVVEVPGDHDNMVLVPNVRVLAEQLKKVIEQAEYSSATPLETPANWLGTAAE
ncbi:MAG: hypothetical protein L3J16_00130, partial [Anaerolineales bacterium]|nr:hypothetical protein [Anaerolineales bacterium]